MYAIGIDIGTTSICGVVLDTDSGKVMESRTEMSNAFLPTSNLWEKIQDTEKIISIAVEILDSFASYNAAVIGLTGQMHGIVYVDANARAVSPLYTWQDARGNESYQGTTYAKYLGSFAGYGNVTDFYNRVNGLRPDGAVTYCTIMDYLAMVLCGRKTPLMHVTNAAGLGCYDLTEKKFVFENQTACGINIEIVDGFQLAGTYKGIPVSVAIGDNQASVFSTLADESDLLLNVGTGSQVSVVSDKIRAGEAIEVRPYFDGKYLIVGAALCGGRSYGILKDFYEAFLQAAGVEGVDVYAVMERMMDDEIAKSVEIEECPLLVDTRFAGTRKRPDLCGGISQVTVSNFTPANLTYGFLQGMVRELYDMYSVMGEKRNNLVGSGNGIRKNKTLIMIAEKMFGGRLQIPAHIEEAAYGAALYGLVACGAFDSAKEAQGLIRYQTQNVKQEKI